MEQSIPHIVNIAVMALVPLGIWVAMGEGMALHWWHKLWTWLPDAICREDFDPPWTHLWMLFYFPLREIARLLRLLAKPLGTCARCMVTGWGVPAVLLLNSGDVSILALLAYIPAAVGLQELIDR